MTSPVIALTEYIEKKWFDVVIECFVIEIHFCEKTEVLAVDRILPSVYFKNRQSAVSIDFVPGRMLHGTF
jgi:hypothetical protein